MGEAIYYLKAKYSTPALATAAAEKLRNFLRQAHDAYWFWQNCRGCGSGVKPIKSEEEFWPKFREQFPQIVKMVAKIKPNGDKIVDQAGWSNALAGNLGVIGELSDIDEVMVGGSLVRYHAEVWHLGDWTHFAQWVADTTEADSVCWKSDEWDEAKWDAVKPTEAAEAK